MPTNRQIYFDLINRNNKYLNKTVIHELLMHVNGFEDETKLLNCFDNECLNYDSFLELLKRIEEGEPLQYVLGYSYFYGRKFCVNKNVLIPRNETEELASIVINLIPQYFLGNTNLTIFDICTGSGILGITLKNEIDGSNVYVSDLSEDALKVVDKNSQILDSEIHILLGDMCEPFINQNLKADVIVCNPPYIPTVDTVDEQTLAHEPHLALFANPSHKFYEEVFKNVNQICNSKYLLAFEIGEDMKDVLESLINKYLPNVSYNFVKDLYNKYRFLIILSR